MVRVILILALFLSACASNEFIIGEEIAAPQGWVDYCKRTPDVDCP